MYDISAAHPQPDGSYNWNIGPTGQLSTNDILEIINENKCSIVIQTAANPAGELFSEARLEAVLRRLNGAGSADIINTVAAEVRGFVGNAQPSDDITMLALRRLDGAQL